MSHSLLAVSGKANPGTEARFRRFGSGLHFSSGIPRLARLLWPEKTAAEMALRTGTSDRACREILAARAKLSADALTALLRTEDGLEFLDVLMEGASPPWWKRFKATVRIGNMRAELTEQRTRIELMREAIAQFELDAADPLPDRRWGEALRRKGRL